MLMRCLPKELKRNISHAWRALSACGFRLLRLPSPSSSSTLHPPRPPRPSLQVFWGKTPPPCESPPPCMTAAFVYRGHALYPTWYSTQLSYPEPSLAFSPSFCCFTVLPHSPPLSTLPTLPFSSLSPASLLLSTHALLSLLSPHPILVLY